MTPRIKATLRYCGIVFLVLVPVYFLCHLLFWPEEGSRVALTTGLMYGAINVLFLGSLHYFRKREEEK